MAPLRKRLKIEHTPSDKEDDTLPNVEAESDLDEQDSASDSRSIASDEQDDGEDDIGSTSASEAYELEEGITKKLADNSEQKRLAKNISKQQEKHNVLQDNAGGKTSGNVLDSRIEDVLRRIRPKHTRREIEAEEALHRIRTTIDAVPALGPFQIRDARRALKEQKIGIPFPDPAPSDESNLKFAYARPAMMNVVGSYPIKTSNRSMKFLHVDMVVQMPDELFQEKDYINYRYFYKRAFYLACLASAIKAAHGKYFELRYQYHHDDPLRPVLTIRSLTQNAGTDGAEFNHNWQINILPAIGPKVFAAAKLVPGKLSLRQEEADLSEDQLVVKNIAYNSSLRADMLVTAYLKLLQQASNSCPAYRDACSLGSAWLRQRGFRATSRKGGFASFEWAALVALLLQDDAVGGRAIIAPHFTSMQIFKTVLQTVASKDLSKRPLEIGSGVSYQASSPAKGPVLWDATRAHNVLYKMPSWSYRRLQTEARMTLAMLGDAEFDGFTASFSINKDNSLLSYDTIIKLKLITPKGKHSLAEQHYFSHDLYRLLKQGLGNRATAVDIKLDRAKAWNVRDGRRLDSAECLVHIGLLVDPKNVDRAVDHGPPAEDKGAAAAFRDFWGGKAELRRFQDGSILEALVWETGAEAAPVLEQVVRYLLLRKYGADLASQVDVVSNAYESMLGLNRKDIGDNSIETFRKLEADIRGLQAVPLPIKQIALASTSLGARSSKRQALSLVDVVMQFESSGRWPDDLAAIQRTKLAFLLNISNGLQDTGDDIHAMVGLENEDNNILNQGYLDIVYPSIAAFRVRIFHDREQTLLERVLKDKTSNSRTSELAAQALATYRREYIRRPAHAQAMLQLSSRHAVFKQTRDLLQKWISSHLLQNHISRELVDLIAAHTFSRPWPWQVSTSVQTAFSRTIVWLAGWDWRTEPLIVDLGTDNKMSATDRKSIRTRFDAWRKLDPAMNKVAAFAASSVDHDGTTYTSEQPSKVIAGRLTMLARAASSEIHAKDLQLPLHSLFSSALTDFDFVIHLNTRFVTGVTSRKSTATFKNLELDSASSAVEVGANPLQDFLHDIDNTYGSATLLLSGLPARPLIGGLWTPQTAERSWKMNLAYSSLPVQATDGIYAQLNTSAILAEIARLGGELVDHIELPKLS